MLLEYAYEYHVTDGSSGKRPHDTLAPSMDGDGEAHGDELGYRIV